MLITTAVVSALKTRDGRSGNTGYIEAGILKPDGNVENSMMPKDYSYSFLYRIADTLPFRMLKTIGAGIAALFLLAVAVFTIGNGFYGYETFSAWAANEEVEEFLNDYESEARSHFSDLSDGYDEDNPPSSFTLSDNPDDGLRYVAWRLLNPGYLNNVQDAVAPIGSSESGIIPAQPETDWMCRGLLDRNGNREPLYGTLMYHNCDVPNLMGEAGQTFLNWFSSPGVRNAEVRDPSPAFGFGIPHLDIIPNNEVPVDRANARNKYTGLEIYGYNLRYTTYVGEWDNIGTLPEARLLANFGFADRLKLGANSVWNGITGAVGGAADGASSSWNSAMDTGGIRYVTAPVEALWGAITGSYEGFAASSIRTFLDTQDYNVFTQNAWYRKSSFTTTLYGNVRELTQDEIADLTDRRQRIDMLESWWEALANFNVQGVDETEALFAIPEPPWDEIRDDEEVAKWESEKADFESAKAEWESQRRIYNALECHDDPEVSCPANHPGREFNNPELPNNIAGKYEFFNPFADDEGYPQYTYETMQDWVNAEPFFSLPTENMSQYSTLVACTNRSDNRENDYAGLADCWTNAVQAQMLELVSENWDALVKDMVARFACRIAPGWICDYQAKYGSENPPVDRRLPPNHPINRFVCPDPQTGDIFRGDHRVRVFNLYAHPNPSHTNTSMLNSAGMVRTANWPNNNCPTEVRPPIQGGLFGDGYTPTWQNDTGRTPPGVDTRREQYNVMNDVLPFISPSGAINGMSNALLWVTLRLTATTNFLIDLAFNPPLKWIGFDDIVSSLIGSFRDSMFFPLSVLAAMIGALSVMMTHVRRREFRQAWWAVAMIFIVFISGFFLMRNPDNLLTLADDIPSTIENSLAAAVFAPFTAGNDQICAPNVNQTPPQGSDSAYGEMEDFQGNSFGSAFVVRSMQCEIWKNYAFTPWVHGQFGTSYQELHDNRMNNTNSALVGVPSVYFGNNVVMNNWALYQLDTMTSGTTTTPDNNEGIGHTSPDIYRLVDLQAGPNNAERSDTRFFDRWSGNEPVGRAFDSLLSVITSIVGLIAVFIYVMIKLEYTLFMTMLLLVTPIIFLIGIEPVKGRSILRKWIGSLAGAMLKRIFAVFLLAVMITMMTFASGTVHNSYIHVSMILMLIALAFIFYRKNFMQWMEDVGNKVGNGSLGQDGHQMPLFGKAFQSGTAKAAQQALTGAIGGGAVGAAKGLGSSISQIGDVSKNTGSSFGDNFSKEWKDRDGTGLRSAVKAAGKGVGSGLRHAASTGAKDAAKAGANIIGSTAKGAMSSAKQSAGIRARNEFTIRRTLGSMGISGRFFDLKGEIERKHKDELSKKKYNDAGREVALDQIDNEIRKNRNQLNSLHKDFSAKDAQLTDAGREAYEKQIQQIEDKINALQNEHEHIKYDKDWQVSMLGKDLDSAAMRRKIRMKQQQRRKLAKRDGQAGLVDSNDAFNRITSIKVDGTNYPALIAEKDAQRSRRHAEMVQKRNYIKKEAESKRELIAKSTEYKDRVDNVIERTQDRLVQTSGADNWDELVASSTLETRRRYKALIDQAIADEKAKIEEDIDEKINRIIEHQLLQEGNSGQFGHSRYAAYGEYDGRRNRTDEEVNVKSVIDITKQRKFEVDSEITDRQIMTNDNGENVGISTYAINIKDTSTGATASFRVSESQDGSHEIHEGTVSTSQGQEELEHKGTLESAMNEIYSRLGAESRAMKEKDNAATMLDNGIADERKSYETYRQDSNGREFKTHHIPEWADKQRLKKTRELDQLQDRTDRSSIERVKQLQSDIQEIDHIESLASKEIAQMQKERKDRITRDFTRNPLKTVKQGSASWSGGRKKYASSDFGGHKRKPTIVRESEIRVKTWSKGKTVSAILEPKAPKNDKK